MVGNYYRGLVIKTILKIALKITLKSTWMEWIQFLISINWPLKHPTTNFFDVIAIFIGNLDHIVNIKAKNKYTTVF